MPAPTCQERAASIISKQAEIISVQAEIQQLTEDKAEIEQAINQKNLDKSALESELYVMQEEYEYYCSGT